MNAEALHSVKLKEEKNAKSKKGKVAKGIKMDLDKVKKVYKCRLQARFISGKRLLILYIILKLPWGYKITSKKGPCLLGLSIPSWTTQVAFFLSSCKRGLNNRKKRRITEH